MCSSGPSGFTRNSAMVSPKREVNCCNLSYVRESLSASTLASVESGIPTWVLIWRSVQPCFWRRCRIKLPKVLFLLAIEPPSRAETTANQPITGTQSGENLLRPAQLCLTRCCLSTRRDGSTQKEKFLLTGYYYPLVDSCQLQGKVLKPKKEWEKACSIARTLHATTQPSWRPWPCLSQHMR